jgi:hypothetical protein
MATSKKPKKATAIAQSIAVRVEADLTYDVQPHYVNVVEVGFSQYEFYITALRTPSKLSPEQIERARAGEAIQVEPSAQLIVSPDLVPQMIETLQKQLALYHSAVTSVKK